MKMTLSIVIILILIGLLAGMFSGLIGIGGAIIMIPALVLILGMDQYSAQGTSLAIMLPPIGLMAAWNYYKAGAIDLRYAMIIAGAFFIGGFFGSKFALGIPEVILRKVFAAILLVIAVKMFFSK
ncbi:MAG: permease [Bacteroidetes bacterium HGW-Bacteroidetes-16]|nr:MAG: permease [Bacteroidetes bacterium HGW-Bacteroidetes-16]